jgi:hypothetical protein
VEGAKLETGNRAAGKLLLCDTTMFSSTAGGVENLRCFWANVIQRPERR